MESRSLDERPAAATAVPPGAADDNSLPIYFSEIKKVPLLSRAEESYYATRARAGCRHSRRILVEANLRFVVKIAMDFHSRGLPLEDLISEGNIGLVKAIERFDPKKGCRLASYAVWWIRQSILRAISGKSRMIHVPRGRARQLLQFVQMQGEPSPNAALQGPRGRSAVVAELMNASRELLSLESPAGDGPSTLSDFVEDRRSGGPEKLLLERALREEIDIVLRSLSHKEAEILRCRFGLGGRRSMTLKMIGRELNLSVERIRQIEKKAKEKFRDSPYAPDGWG